MFNIGWAEFLVLVVIGLFVFGPERLPGAAAWLGRTVRQVREYATGAREQLRSELGPEYDELRQPLEDLRGLRDVNPKRAATKYMFEDDEGRDTPDGYPGPNVRSVAQPRLEPGEKAPFDPDAT